MAAVILDNVTKVYPGGVVAVKDAFLKIQDEEFLVLVGPSEVVQSEGTHGRVEYPSPHVVAQVVSVEAKA